MFFFHVVFTKGKKKRFIAETAMRAFSSVTSNDVTLSRCHLIANTFKWKFKSLFFYQLLPIQPQSKPSIILQIVKNTASCSTLMAINVRLLRAYNVATFNCSVTAGRFTFKLITTIKAINKTKLPCQTWISAQI